MENSATQPIIVKSGSSIGTPAIVAISLLFVGGYFVGKKLLSQRSENMAEAQTNTPEGQIALQLKNVFDKFPVSDADYQTAALQINATNKAKVYELYRNLTGRNLSDDIASHINSDAQAKATKIEKYNSKPGKLFSITADNKIKFEVVPGDSIRFTPGQTTPVTFYNSEFGIVLKELNSADLNKKLASDPKTAAITVKLDVKPSARLFKVLATKEIPYSSIQQASGFFKYVRPYVNVKKTFAAVKILVGTDPKSKKPVMMWVDARDLVTFKQTTVKGLEGNGKKLHAELNPMSKNLI